MSWWRGLSVPWKVTLLIAVLTAVAILAGPAGAGFSNDPSRNRVTALVVGVALNCLVAFAITWTAVRLYSRVRRISRQPVHENVLAAQGIMALDYYFLRVAKAQFAEAGDDEAEGLLAECRRWFVDPNPDKAWAYRMSALRRIGATWDEEARADFQERSQRPWMPTPKVIARWDRLTSKARESYLRQASVVDRAATRAYFG